MSEVLGGHPQVEQRGPGTDGELAIVGVDDPDRPPPVRMHLDIGGVDAKEPRLGVVV
ncbi:MAG: hypothetical protein M5U12_10825 [Verrucomicrobia bacterium]|nr:hypothetical protein [Verrucomicrobiota bacterium]